VLQVRAVVDSHADRAGGQRLDGEQALHFRQGADAHAQTVTVVHDLGRAVLVDDIDDTAREAILAAVEEEDALKRMTLVARDPRREFDSPHETSPGRVNGTGRRSDRSCSRHWIMSSEPPQNCCCNATK
jgi:hypothetical protein